MGNSSLHAAAEKGDHKLIEQLLTSENKPYVDVRDWKGRTALHRACIVRNNEESILTLVRFGANLFAKTEGDGLTPSALVCTKKSPNVRNIRTLRALGGITDTDFKILTKTVKNIHRQAACGCIHDDAIYPIRPKEILRIRKEVYFRDSLTFRLLLCVE